MTLREGAVIALMSLGLPLHSTPKWGTTTPIRYSSTNVFTKGTEIEYNAIAAKVMAKHGVPTNDMYTFVKSLIDMNKPAGHGADPFFFDRKPIHPPLLDILRKYLGVAPINLPKP